MENNLTVEMPEEDLITLMREIRKLHRMGGTATMFYCEIGASVRICLHKNKTTYEKTFILDPERKRLQMYVSKMFKDIEKNTDNYRRKKMNNEQIMNLIREIFEVQAAGNYVSFTCNNFGIEVFVMRGEKKKSKEWDRTFFFCKMFSEKRTEEMYQECLEYLNKMKETV